MKYEYLFISLNIAGLILDLIGFILIYKTRLKDVGKVSKSMPFFRARMGGNESFENVSKEIIKEVNRRLEEMNTARISRDNETLKYFLLIVYGVSIQIISIILSLSFSIFYQ